MLHKAGGGGGDRQPNKRIWQAEGVQRKQKDVPESARVQPGNVLDVPRDLALE